MATKNSDLIREARELAESSLEHFIMLVAPHRVLGPVHKELIKWWTREDAKDHQLVLLPRDHQKSAMIAYRVAWEITRDPSITFLYMSATATLAEKQLYFIKNIFLSKAYQRYWPEMINPDEGKREKWSATEICVDHPKRRDLGIRDATITTAGLTKTITGLHFDRAVLDDVVVKENAYNEEGRQKVKEAYSLLASIESTGSQEWVVGTRYHPQDLYTELQSMSEEIWEDNEIIGARPVYEVFERQLEDSPNRDGSGEYLWPKMPRHDGRMFGFDPQERARKYAKYLDKGQFFAQYYNDPTDPENLKIDISLFQYYNRENARLYDGKCYVGKEEVKVYAAIDFATSTNRKADYTAIVVVGVDSENRYFVLDIDRFKTDRISDMFDHLMSLKMKWNFIKLRAETNGQQKVIVTRIKELQRENNLFFSIDEIQPDKHGPNKEERMLNVLLPRYEVGAIFHYAGGNTAILEGELTQHHPSHDDCMDALANAIEIAQPPARAMHRHRRDNVVQFNSRFGGVAHG